MNLKDVFDALSSGELRLSHLVETGMDDTEVRKTLLPLIQRGLTELHTRFRIREQSATLPLTEGQTVYTLDDTVTPRLLKVVSVSAEYPEGMVMTHYPLNQAGNLESFRTPTYNTLVLPRVFTVPVTEITLDYLQDHPLITTEDALYDMPENITIELPVPYLEPLVLYVAAKVHIGNGAGDGIDLGSQLQAQYELACQKLEMYNMDNDTLETYDVIRENGWV